jgi:hypothetical protein
MRKWAEKKMLLLEEKLTDFHIPKVLNGPDNEFFDIADQADILQEFNKQRVAQESRIENAALTKLAEKNEKGGYVDRCGEIAEEKLKENTKKIPEQEHNGNIENEAIRNYAKSFAGILRKEAFTERSNNEEFLKRKDTLVKEDRGFETKIRDDNPYCEDEKADFKKLIRNTEFSAMTQTQKDEATLYFLREKHQAEQEEIPVSDEVPQTEPDDSALPTIDEVEPESTGGASHLRRAQARKGNQNGGRTP